MIWGGRFGGAERMVSMRGGSVMRHMGWAGLGWAGEDAGVGVLGGREGREGREGGWGLEHENAGRFSSRWR